MLYLLGLWPARGQYFVCALRRINVIYRFFLAFLLFLPLPFSSSFAWSMLFALYSFCFLRTSVHLNHFLLFLFPCVHTNHTVFEMFLSRVLCHYYCCSIALSTLDIFIPNFRRYRSAPLICCHTPVSLCSMLLYFRTLFSMYKEILAEKKNMAELVFEQKEQAKGKKVNSQNTVIVIFALSS